MTEAVGTLLLVDDDEAKRYLLGTWLRRAGHTVTEALTGRDALGKLDGIELVLFDVNLPDISGYEVIEFVRGQDKLRQLPILVVTTRGDESSRARALGAGATSFMTKPFSPTDLLGEVRGLIGARPGVPA